MMQNIVDNSPKIKVVIRKRPLSKKETLQKELDIIEVLKPQSIIVRELKLKVDLTKYTEENAFTFDNVFDEFTQNHEMYSLTIKPLVNAFFNKTRCTVFAYGQTGSGKTYTMMGDSNNPNQNPGLYLLAAQDIFQFLSQVKIAQILLLLKQQYKKISKFQNKPLKFLLIYILENLLQIREDAKQNVNIIGLTERKIENIQDLMLAIQNGMQCRSTSQTSKNDESSRSHAILQISLMEDSQVASKKLGGARGGFVQEKTKVVYSKMSFIDLAGSERARDVTDTNKQTRIDGAEINKSLLALKECIRALDMSKNHKPFRGSKLTQVLKDSLTGNCKTVMIGNVSPGLNSSENTLNTLRYSDRVKELKKKNRDEPDFQPQQMQFQDNKPKEILTDEQSDDENYEFSDQSLEMQETLEVQQRQQQENYQNMFNNNNNYQQQNFFSNQQQQQFQQQKQQQQQQFQQLQKQDYFQQSNQFNQQNNSGFQSNNQQNNSGFQQNNQQNYEEEFFENNQENQLIKLQNQHQTLVQKIVEDEQNLILQHHLNIKKSAEILNQEQKMLDDINTQQFDPESYMSWLGETLDDKLEMIVMIKKQMKQIKQQLRKEKDLNLQFQNLKNSSLNIFEVKNQNFLN